MAEADPLVSYLIVTHERTDDAIEAIQSALDQDYPNKEVVVVASVAGDTYEVLSEHFADHTEVRIFQEEKRRGPPGARNEALDHARGDILTTIDDDAVYRDPEATRRFVAEFERYPDVGALSFRSVRYDTGEDLLIEIPRGPEGKKPEEPYFTTYFVGVGAAFRRETIEAVAGFPEEFFYYKEELDLSFQLLKAGYEIRYLPTVVVRHKESVGSRPSRDEQWRLTLQNRMRVAVRHLPWRHVVVSSLIWTAYVLWRTTFSVRVVARAYRNVLADRERLLEQRDVIDADTKRRIADLAGRLWY